MFDIAPTELMLLGAVALVVIGPKDLPRAMRFVGQWVGRARGMARHFRMGVDEIIRQAELDEMQQKWAAENARIMAEHPMPPPEEADDAAHALLPGDTPAMTPLPAPEASDEAMAGAFGEVDSEPARSSEDADAAGEDPQMSIFSMPEPSFGPEPQPDDPAKPAETPRP